MKKFLILIAGLFLILACGQTQEGVVSYWPFDENEGKIALDNVAMMQDSISYIFNDNAPFSDPIRKKGVLGNALEFDGFSSYVERESSFFSFPESSFTVSVWVAPRAFEHCDENKLSAIVNQQDLTAKEGFCLGLFRHGKWSFQMGDGNNWYEVWADSNPVPRRQWSFLTAVFDADADELSLYLNAEKVASETVDASGVVQSSNPLIIGRHNQPYKEGRHYLNMFNGLMDELMIFDYAMSADQVSTYLKKYLRKHKGSMPVLAFEDIIIDREKYRNDPYRPELHANPPGHWMNEPHAPFFYNGKYHLTYQHNPTGPYWHQIHWGHWVSEDLVHWEDMPEVIFPEDNDVAPDGIWSGGVTYDPQGVPVLIYTFGNWAKERNQGIALAFPDDKDDPYLTKWNTLPHTTIEQQPGQGITGEFRDPFVWRDEESGKWYMVVGSGIPGEGGTAWAYESDNVLDWTFKGPFYISNYEKYPFLGDKWELPVVLPLGKYPDGEDRYVMIVSPKGYLQNVEVYYWLGRFDKVNCRFIPDDEEPLYWDYGGNRFIGPSGLIDQKGRALIFTVVGGGGNGWAGTCGFPSHIFLDEEGKLGVKHIEELSSLRTAQLLSIADKTVDEANEALKDISGKMLEIYLEIDCAGADTAGISFLRDPDGREETIIYYDAVNGKLLHDLSKSQIRDSDRPYRPRRRSTDMRDELRNSFRLEDGETMKLRIFIDKALIQAYVNDRNTITTWAYPKLEQSNGLEVFANGGSPVVKTMEVWELGSIYY